MKSFRLTLRPNGPWASPWHADSLFGAICWKRRLVWGEAALLNWLDGFRAAHPPFVLSDAFPEGLLPAPQGLRYKLSEVKAKRPYWLSHENFRSLAAGLISSEDVELYAGKVLTDVTRLMASLGRDTDRTEFGGALFEQEAAAAAADHPNLELYFRAEDPSEFEETVRLLAWAGFGKKSSSGFGAFEVEGAAARCEWLDITPDATGFVALSHFVPAMQDPTDGRWRTHVKYPKYHGNAVSHPFKGRLTTLVPGSSFRTDGPVRSWYGRVIEMPIDGLSALHYGLAFAAPFAWHD